MRRDVILGEHLRAKSSDSPAARVTLDDLFRRAVAQRADALALADPPDRPTFTDGAPRRLTFAEADRVISAIAARLRELGLPTDAIVALHLPNTVESVLMLLGVLRAGMIAAPLPLLWRQADAATALGRIGARALISCRRIGEVSFGELAMHIAAETFPIRFVGAFGDGLPDGVVPLDDVFDAAPATAVAPVARAGNPADHVAVVTFDVSPDGITPVARSHAELLAAGLAVELEARAGPEAGILGALAVASFAGIATTIVPWLLVGGTLSLHHPFDPDAFAVQRAGDLCSVAVVPGPLAQRLLGAGLLGGRQGPETVIAVWRAPERLSASAAWPGDGTALVDVPVFGEIGLIAMRRAGDRAAGLHLGRIMAAQGTAGATHVLDISRTPAGTIALAGPMVPRFPFPPGSERSDGPRLKPAEDGSVDTGYACRIDRETKLLEVDGPPAGIVSVGGYRFVLRELQDLIGRIEDGSTLAALPDVLAGHRLAGGGIDRDAIRQALIDQGASPLLVAAFSPRRPGQKASAA